MTELGHEFSFSFFNYLFAKILTSNVIIVAKVVYRNTDQVVFSFTAVAPE